MPRCSVIVVTYNSGAQIEACLRALASQDCEIVVVDNASQDDTVARVQALAAQIPLQLHHHFAQHRLCRRRESGSPRRQRRGAADSQSGCSGGTGRGRCDAGVPGTFRGSAAGGALLESDGQPAKGFAFRRTSDADQPVVRSAAGESGVAGESGESALSLPRRRLFEAAAGRAAGGGLPGRYAQGVGCGAGHGYDVLSGLV